MQDKPMTKHRLEQYTKLRREIEALDEQIYFAGVSGGGSLTDSVRGSSTSIPYQQHNVAVQGYGSDAIPRLSARKAAKCAECKAVETYIDSIDDSIMWQLLTRRYIEGKTVAETAQLVGYSEVHVGRLINERFKK